MKRSILFVSAFVSLCFCFASYSEAQCTQVGAPSATLYSPTNGATVSGIVAITYGGTYGQASDGTDSSNTCSDSTSFQLYIDGVNVDWNGQDPTTYQWNTSKVTDGRHTIYVEAVDDYSWDQTQTITVIVNSNIYAAGQYILPNGEGFYFNGAGAYCSYVTDINPATATPINAIPTSVANNGFCSGNNYLPAGQPAGQYILPSGAALYSNGGAYCTYPASVTAAQVPNAASIPSVPTGIVNNGPCG